MKALFIGGKNQYGVVSHFLDGMRRDLQKLAVWVDEIHVDINGDAESGQTQVERLQDYDFVVSFNAVGLTIRNESISLIDFMQTKTVYLFAVDHPIHLLNRFVGLPVTVLCVDQEHVEFCRLCGIKAEYFPHGVASDDVALNDYLPYAQKEAEVIYPVSYFDLAHWQRQLNPLWHRIGTALEKVGNITQFMQEIGLLPTANKPARLGLNEDIRKICVYADLYIRARLRQQFLIDAQAQNIPLLVIGRNSEKYKAVAGMHSYLPDMPYSQLRERIANAMWVAHNSPGFARGLHERIVVPLAMGTLVVGNDLSFATQQFSASRAVITQKHMPSIDSADYEHRQQAALRQIQQEHTWERRWQGLLGLSLI